MDPPKIHRRAKKGKKRKRQDAHLQPNNTKRSVGNNESKISVRSEHEVTSRAGRLSNLQTNFKAKLESARFRWLNEQLYSKPSLESLELFKRSPELYQVYHRGFRSQVDKWPTNPAHVIAEYVASLPPEWNVADFGCGDALIARSVPHTVHSFDLCKTNEFVTVANSASVPLDDQSIDVAVFCLSLMGTDFLAFLTEARRTLKMNGLLVVAEVKSRFSASSGDFSNNARLETDISEGAGRRSRQEIKKSDMMDGICNFKKTLRRIGFDLELEDLSNKMFVLFHFIKKELPTQPKYGKKARGKEFKKIDEEFEFKSCKYKKR